MLFQNEEDAATVYSDPEDTGTTVGDTLSQMFNWFDVSDGGFAAETDAAVRNAEGMPEFLNMDSDPGVQPSAQDGLIDLDSIPGADQFHEHDEPAPVDLDSIPGADQFHAANEPVPVDFDSIPGADQFHSVSEQEATFRDLDALANTLMQQNPDDMLKILDVDITRLEEDKEMTMHEIAVTIEAMQGQKEELMDAMEQGKGLDPETLQKYQENVENLCCQQEKLKSVNGRICALGAQKDEVIRECKKQARQEFKHDAMQMGATLVAGAHAIASSLSNGLIDIGNYLHERVEAFRQGAQEAFRSVGDTVEHMYNKILLKQKDIGRWMDDRTQDLQKARTHVQESARTGMQTVKTGAQLGVEKAKGDFTRDSLQNLMNKAQRQMQVMAKTEGPDRGAFSNMRYNFALDNCRRDMAAISDTIGRRIADMEGRMKDVKPVDKAEYTYFKGLKDLADGRPMGEERTKDFAKSAHTISAREGAFMAVSAKSLAEQIKTAGKNLEGKSAQLFTRQTQMPDR